MYVLDGGLGEGGGEVCVDYCVWSCPHSYIICTFPIRAYGKNTHTPTPPDHTHTTHVRTGIVLTTGKRCHSTAMNSKPTARRTGYTTRSMTIRLLRSPTTAILNEKTHTPPLPYRNHGNVQKRTSLKSLFKKGHNSALAFRSCAPR